MVPFFAGALAVGSEAPVPPTIIQLPTFVVTDNHLPPKQELWRYTRIPGFEVISNASDRTTRRILQDLAEFIQAVDLVWPGLAGPSYGTDTLILCGRHDKFGEFVPFASTSTSGGTASRTYRDRESTVIVLDLENTSINLATADGNGVPIDQYKELHREYLHYLFARLDPEPPPWLEEGLAQMLSTMEYQRSAIVFARLPDMSEEVAKAQEEQAAAAVLRMFSGPSASMEARPPPGVDPAPGKGFNATFAQGAGIMPLGKMFSMSRDSDEAKNTIGGLWPKQCWAFVHLCLYGEGRRHQKALLEFVARAERQPVTEELFKECFGMSYRQMQMELGEYSSFTDYRYYTFKLPREHWLTQPDLALREATDGEVGRIKGEALDMAGNKAAARYALLAPYVRGSREPDLLAALGLNKIENGEIASGRALLEAAVAGGTTRARAYAQLGQLRLSESLAKPLGGGGKLAPKQLAYILAPLEAARNVPPPVPETFKATAQALERADLNLSRQDLASVNAGVLLFPQDMELLYLDAKLHAENHLADDAAKLARYGAQVAPDASTRTRFAELLATVQ